MTTTTRQAGLVGRRVGPRVYGRPASPLTAVQQSIAEKRHALITRLIASNPQLNRLAFGLWPKEFLKQIKELI